MKTFIKEMLSSKGEPSSKRTISFIGVIFYVIIISIIITYFMITNPGDSAIERNLTTILIAAGSVPLAAQGMTLLRKKDV